MSARRHSALTAPSERSRSTSSLVALGLALWIALACGGSTRDATGTSAPLTVGGGEPATVDRPIDEILRALDDAERTGEADARSELLRALDVCALATVPCDRSSDEAPRGRPADGPSARLRAALADDLPRWGDAVLAADGAGAAKVEAQLLDAWGSTGGTTAPDDRTAERIVERLRSADGMLRTRLARAVVRYRKAEALRDATRYEDAKAIYREASASLADDLPELSRWAGLGAVICEISAGENEAARATVLAVRATTDPATEPILAARLDWQDGLIGLRQGRLAEASRDLGRAAERFEDLGDLEPRAAMLLMRAEALSTLGLVDEAWTDRAEAFAALGRRPSIMLHNLLLTTAFAARLEGLPHAAVALQRADVEIARRLGDPTAVVEAQIWLARALLAVERTPPALDVLSEADGLLGDVPDPRLRARLHADLAECRGALLVDSDPVAAAALLERPIRHYRAIDYRWKLPLTLTLRARALVAAGDARAAEATLDEALEEIERRDASLPPAVLRATHFEGAQELFDLALDQALERDASALETLALAERSRRTLVRLAHAAETRPAETRPADTRPADTRPADPVGEAALRERIERLPDEVALVEYALLPDRLVTWTIFRGSVERRVAPRAGLDELVDAAWRSLASSDRRTSSERPGSSERRAERGASVAVDALSERLVTPWLDRLDGATTLVFAPDRVLHGVPFAALRDTASQRWLARDHRIETTPGLMAFDADRPVDPGSPTTIALFADPSPRPDVPGPLERLPGALQEARALAAIHQDADPDLYFGDDATRAAFLDSLDHARIVHYAGHAIERPLQPWQSFLPLAPPSAPEAGARADDRGLLLARDLYARRGLDPNRHGPDVVVLSACGAPSRGEVRAAGFAPLVSALLAGGARAVVASHWPVDDHSIGRLAVAFHRGLARGLDPSTALYEARLLLIDEPPGVWASYQLTRAATEPARPDPPAAD